MDHRSQSFRVSLPHTISAHCHPGHPVIYRYDLTVRPDAVDRNGHVNNVEYVRWMQDAAIAHARAAGGQALSDAEGWTWYVRSHQVEYLQPVFQDEEIAVLTWASDIRKTRALRKYLMVRVSEDKPVARGQTEWVAVDVGSGRPRPVPRGIIELFPAVPDDQAPRNLSDVTRVIE